MFKVLIFCLLSLVVLSYKDYDFDYFRGWKYGRGYKPYEKIIDCSHLVHKIYKRSGRIYPYTTSVVWRDVAPDNFIQIPEEEVTLGDIILFRGHIGIVKRPGYYFGSQRRGPAHSHYGPDRFWGKN